MKTENGYLIFSTGKRVYCFGNSMGINLVENCASGGMSVFYGSDGSISTYMDDWLDDNDKLTKEECQELADAMIARWQEFKDRTNVLMPTDDISNIEKSSN